MAEVPATESPADRAAWRRLAARAAAQAMSCDEAGPVPSPCISVCRMDEVSGLCVGCLRSLDEIVRWGQSDDRARAATWHRLAARASAALATGALTGDVGRIGR